MKSPCLRAFIGSAALLLMASGCFVGLEHPLSNPDDARPDPALVGKWSETKDKSTSTYRLGFDGRGLLRSETQLAGGLWKKDPSDGTFVTRTAHASYLNTPTTESDPKRPGRKRTFYHFTRYRVSADGKTLTMLFPKVAAFRQAVLTGKLKGRIERTELAPKKDGSRDDSQDAAILQDSPAAILGFLDSLPTKELFEFESVLKKVD